MIAEKRIRTSDVEAIAREFLERARAMDNGKADSPAVSDYEFETLVREEVELLVSQMRGIGADIAD